MVDAGSLDSHSPPERCRRILDSLRQRKADRSAGDLETLLTYFIQLAPTSAAFNDLLKQYAQDNRPGIASTAKLLQQAWERTGATAALPAQTPLAEVLRTLGALLDESGAHAAYLALARDRPRLHLFIERGEGRDLTHRTMGLLELNMQVSARTALRGQVPAQDPASAERFATRLRGVGVDQDREEAQSYELLITHRTIVVEDSAG